MRIVSKNTLRIMWIKYREAEHPLKTWYEEVRKSDWTNHNDMKRTFRNASIVGPKRVIFNIKGNKYRLIVDIEYHIRLMFIVWFGTHSEYDKINVKSIAYDKGN